LGKSTNVFPNRFMKIKIRQFREIADVLLQVHACKKVILLSLQMLGKGGACFYHQILERLYLNDANN
jgi:hypothetical protein